MDAVRILSLDGGGIRGIIQAKVLEYIEAKAGKPATECFDLIAGTSTGGILGCGLCVKGDGGKPKFPAATMVKLYRDNGGTIFHSSFWHGFGSLGGMVDEKYEADGLEKVLREYFGDALLSGSLGRLLVTSYDIAQRQPYFFKSWKAGEDMDRDHFLRDVARSTSAAPTYFEPCLCPSRGGAQRPLIDGGVFANNPGMCAMASARTLFPDAKNFLVVSLGAGETKREIPYPKAKNWGLMGWARPLLYILFDGVSDSVDYELEQEVGKNYFRFQVEIGDAANDDMDDVRPENIAGLERLAEKLIGREKARLDQVAAIL